MITRRSKTNFCCILLIAAMAILSTGMASYDCCGCDRAYDDLEMPAISDPGCGTSCCDRSEQDDDCCCTVERRGDEPRIDGSLPQSRLDDDASASQSPSESMLRIAAGQHRCIESTFRIDRLPPHLCTTVLLI